MATNSVGTQKTIQQIVDSGITNTNDRKVGELGKDDFLNLLVTQLRYQDPLKPTEDKEFIGQMAQFSSLEQMQNMSNSLAQSQAFSLIGKRITAAVTDDKTKETKAVEGDVTSVKVSSGKTYLIVNGEEVPIEKVVDVTEGTRSSQSNISSYANLIGYNANGVVYDSGTSDMLMVSGSVQAIQKGVYEDYAVMDGVKVEISDIVSDIHSTDPSYKKDYLTSNVGKEVSVNVVDRNTNKKVPVTATLKEFNIAVDGTITATLDGVHVSVESISKITPAKQTTTQSTITTTTNNTSTNTGSDTTTTDTSSSETTGADSNENNNSDENASESL